MHKVLKRIYILSFVLFSMLLLWCVWCALLYSMLFNAVINARTYTCEYFDSVCRLFMILVLFSDDFRCQVTCWCCAIAMQCTHFHDDATANCVTVANSLPHDARLPHGNARRSLWLNILTQCDSKTKLMRWLQLQWERKGEKERE